MCTYIAVQNTLFCSVLSLQESQCTKQAQEISKLKEEVSSLQIKMKWAQNKLKTETEAHKVTVQVHISKCRWHSVALSPATPENFMIIVVSSL